MRISVRIIKQGLMTFLFTLISTISISQVIGEGLTSGKPIISNQYSSCRVYSLPWYKDGYYEGYVLDLADLVEYNRHGSDYRMWYQKWFLDQIIDGQQVASGDHSVASYNLKIDRNVKVYFSASQGKPGSSSTSFVPGHLWDIRVIRWNFNPPVQVCLTSNALNLRNYIKTSFGTYASGNFPGGHFEGTDGSSYFDPSLAGIGTHAITFTYGEKSVTKTIQVVAPTTITESLPSTVYNTDKSGSTIGRLDLRNYVNQSGGSFEVTLNGSKQTLLDGRYLNLFNIISETDYSTTSRDIVVKYTYTNGPCTQVKTKTITVNNNNINISLGN